ncbi:hypothetical protein [Halarchaeum acidiphilum]|uniref:hypothetical protein n=1 Tax=Halarchaeum acidiphilum TaxID=489138 RepID=UPI0011DE4E94|nr:hypothetical protein [Halarchaeum acidiphilum]
MDGKPGARPSASTVADAVRDLADPRPPAAGVPHEGGNAPPIPPAVTAWLDGLEGRIEAGATSEDEWRALAAVGERIGALAGRA